MTEPFRGILHGATTVPGFEPDQSSPESVVCHAYVCDFCEQRFPNMDGWQHTYISSACPECARGFES